ncbi:MAG: shikimate kinase [Lachnospiraceae bacterium]|nr:shikimate kinase [Lachnospiraceae bacterium]
MGSGKSAVGRAAASKLGVGFIDTDAEIERKQNSSINDIFAVSGEESFRQMETAELYGLLLSDTDAVISLGGGTPVRKANQRVIKELGYTIYLKGSAEMLVKRLERGTENRPMLKGYDLHERVEELLRLREEEYLKIADAVVEISDEDVNTMSDRVLKVYRRLL